MTYLKGKTYKFAKDIVELYDECPEARFQMSHTNEYGTVFFKEITDKDSQVDQFFRLTKDDQEMAVLVLDLPKELEERRDLNIAIHHATMNFNQTVSLEDFKAVAKLLGI